MTSISNRFGLTASTTYQVTTENANRVNKYQEPLTQTNNALFHFVKPHIEGAAQVVTGNVRMIKNHPWMSLGLASAIIGIGKRFPKVAAAANIGLVGNFTAGILREEYQAATAGSESDRYQHLQRAGNQMLNAGVMGLGFTDALKTVSTPLKATPFARVSETKTHFGTLFGLAEDGLFALNVPQQDKTFLAAPVAIQKNTVQQQVFQENAFLASDTTIPISSNVQDIQPQLR